MLLFSWYYMTITFPRVLDAICICKDNVHSRATVRIYHEYACLRSSLVKTRPKPCRKVSMGG